MSEEELESLNSEQFMAKWAEMLVAGVKTQEKPAVVTVTTATVEIEHERLKFKRDKWPAEITSKQLEREAESNRHAWERQQADEEKAEREQRYKLENEEREERRRLEEERKQLEALRLKREDEEREERRQLETAGFKQKQQRLTLMAEANKLKCASAGKKHTKVDSVTCKLKQYGDALRHSFFKMADNPLELISCFDSI